MAITALKDNNNTLVTDPEHKAQLLNTHFQSVFTQENNRTLDTADNPYPPIPALDVTTHRIMKLLLTLDINKATGSDKIPALILKSCAHILQIIFTQSLNNSTLPDDWLCTNVANPPY